MKKKQFETITISSFGEPVVIVGRVVGGYRNGFNSSSGAWCLSDLGGGEYTYTKAYFVLIVEKGCRKPIGMNCKYIMSCIPVEKNK